MLSPKARLVMKLSGCDHSIRHLMNQEVPAKHLVHCVYNIIPLKMRVRKEDLKVDHCYKKELIRNQEVPAN
jgi:hypothetical protein